MRYLHTMVRVKDLDASLDFYCDKLGLKETRRIENKMGRFTLVFLDRDGRALSIRTEMRPRRLARQRGAIAVLELPAGTEVVLAESGQFTVEGGERVPAAAV